LPTLVKTANLFELKCLRVVYKQVATVRRLCRTYVDGFFVADLANLCQLLDLLASIVESGREEFVDPLCEVLEVCAMPFVKEIASEEYRNFGALCDTLAALGRLLLSPNRTVALAAGAALEKYAGAEDEAPATISYHHQVIEHSKVAASLARALGGGTSEDRVMQLQLVRIVLELSRTRDLAAVLMDCGCMSGVAQALSCGFKAEVVACAIEALWNVFELCPEAVDKVACENVVATMKTLLDELLSEGHRAQDKQLRNELLVLVTFVANSLGTHDLIASTGLLEVMLTVASALESEVPPPNVKPFVLTAAVEDVEMKRVMVHVASLVASNSWCMEQISLHPNFIPALVLHLDGRLSGHPARSKYTQQQQRQVQVQCLAVLAQVVPHCADLFRELDGLEVVVSCLTEQSEESMRLGCLRLLSVSSNLPAYQQELGGRTVAMMLSLVKERSMHPFAVRQEAMGVLSRLCMDNEDNRSVVGDLNGIQTLIDNLEWTVEEATRREPMCVTTVDAVWNVVAGNPENEDMFEQAGGLDALLCVLEDCSRPVKLLVVSCLAQLMESDALCEAILEWRSLATRRNVVALLVTLWADEEEHSQKERRQHVEVHNIDALQEAEMESEVLVRHLTGQNMQTKLHALLARIGFEHCEAELSAEQQKLLLTIETYVENRDALLWRAFHRELDAEGVRPVTPDARRVMDRERQEQESQDALADAVFDVAAEDTAREEQVLQQFYAHVHAQERAKHSTAKFFNAAAPASTRTKIIVDSHKAQVFPPLMSADQEEEPSTPPAVPITNNAPAERSERLGAFLESDAAIRAAAARPGSGRPRSGRAAGEGVTPAGGGVHAAAALRSS
jgi:hypothetical protein